MGRVMVSLKLASPARPLTMQVKLAPGTALVGTFTVRVAMGPLFTAPSTVKRRTSVALL